MRVHNLTVAVFLTIWFAFIYSLVAADFSGKNVGVIDGDTIKRPRHPSSHDVPLGGDKKRGAMGAAVLAGRAR